MDYLRSRDRRLAEIINKVGKIERKVVPDLFVALVQTIVGQQISMRAFETVWRRLETAVGHVAPQTIDRLTETELQAVGMSGRKALYIKRVATRMLDGTLRPDELRDRPDAEVLSRLTQIDGIGPWSAEMLMLFCLQRRDVLSYGDLGIRRGLCLLYHHRELTRERFERYRRRFSPCGSVASFYLWALAGGEVACP